MRNPSPEDLKAADEALTEAQQKSSLGPENWLVELFKGGVALLRAKFAFASEDIAAMCAFLHDAEIAYSDVRVREPGNAPALSRALLGLGEAELARSFGECTSKRTDGAKLDIGGVQKAVEYVESATATYRSPDIAAEAAFLFGDAYVLMGEVGRRGDWDLAIHEFQKVITAAGSDKNLQFLLAGAHANMAHAYWKGPAHDLALAAREYKTAIDMPADRAQKPRYEYELAQVYEGLKDYARADTYWDLAMHYAWTRQDAQLYSGQRELYKKQRIIR
jgi:tetratricopeptide (TPR) repeat protein